MTALAFTSAPARMRNSTKSRGPLPTRTRSGVTRPSGLNRHRRRPQTRLAPQPQFPHGKWLDRPRYVEECVYKLCRTEERIYNRFNTKKALVGVLCLNVQVRRTCRLDAGGTSTKPSISSCSRLFLRTECTRYASSRLGETVQLSHRMWNTSRYALTPVDMSSFVQSEQFTPASTRRRRDCAMAGPFFITCTTPPTWRTHLLDFPGRSFFPQFPAAHPWQRRSDSGGGQHAPGRHGRYRQRVYHW